MKGGEEMGALVISKRFCFCTLRFKSFSSDVGQMADSDLVL